MAYRASHRFARISPLKARMVANLIRRRPVDEALEALRFMPNRGARLFEQVIKTAMANAEDQGARRLEDMVLVDVRVDEGPRYKRIQPRARGMAFGIIKRMAHLRVAIDTAG